MTTVRELFECLEQGDEVFLPSRFWETLNERHMEELESVGYDYFKQTIASNYFTWLISPKNNQFRYLLRHTRLSDWRSILGDPLTVDAGSRLSRRQQLFLQVYTRMLWRFVERFDTEQILRQLEEPGEGGPFRIVLDGKVISQDLANSVLEYYAIREHFSKSRDERVTICELGAGYGRNAYLFLKLFPKCRYIIIDIPPALHIAQRYLSSVFADRHVLSPRCFDDADHFATEMHAADIVFLLPHQAVMLADQSVDLFLNISSLHEMNPLQIQAYMTMIDRLTSGVFYTKQWEISRNPYDNMVVRKADYPIPSHWVELYSRPAKVQTTFFEAMYATD